MDAKEYERYKKNQAKIKDYMAKAKKGSTYRDQYGNVKEYSDFKRGEYFGRARELQGVPPNFSIFSKKKSN